MADGPSVAFFGGFLVQKDSRVGRSSSLLKIQHDLVQPAIILIAKARRVQEPAADLDLAQIKQHRLHLLGVDPLCRARVIPFRGFMKHDGEAAPGRAGLAVDYGVDAVAAALDDHCRQAQAIQIAVGHVMA